MGDGCGEIKAFAQYFCPAKTGLSLLKINHPNSLPGVTLLLPTSYCQESFQDAKYQIIFTSDIENAFANSGPLISLIFIMSNLSPTLLIVANCMENSENETRLSVNDKSISSKHQANCNLQDYYIYLELSPKKTRKL